MKRAMMVVLIMLLLMGTAGAESYGWVMCQPDSQVNIRGGPGQRYSVVAHRYAGDRVLLDGKKRGKWVHCVLSCESGEGWIRRDFLSLDEPEDVGSGIFITTVGRVNARYSAGGGIRKKLKEGTALTVSMVTAEWCVTSQGFIRTEFLMEVNGNVPPM